MDLTNRVLMKKRVYKFFLIHLIFLFFISPLSARTNLLDFDRLDGEWELFIQKTPQQVREILLEGGRSDSNPIIPGFWNIDVFNYTGENTPRTYGTYRLNLVGLEPSEQYSFFMMDSPGTSCAVYVNDKQYVQNGNPFLNISTKDKIKFFDSEIKPIYFEFTPDNNGNAEILFFVNNYFYRKSGIWDSIIFGKAKNVYMLYLVMMAFNMLMTGILLFIGLLNIIQFIINKTRKEYMWLGITAIVFAFRVSTADFNLLSMIFPIISASLKYKLEYMSTWFVPFAILKMLCIIYPIESEYIIFKKFKEKYIRYFLYCLTGVIGILTFVLPISLANYLVTPSQISFGLYSIYIIILIISNIIRKRKHIMYYFFSCGILIIGGGITVAYTINKSILPFSIFPFFLVIFVFIQLLLLATIQNEIYLETIKTTESLKILNESYLKFVPSEFLSLLNKDSITNIKLGDFSNIEMSIIFSKFDIQFMNNNYSQETHYKIFNQYLQKISPIIKENNGFVTKFLSGGFVALFSNSPSDAIKAAVKIKELVIQLNKIFDFNDSTVKIIPRIGVHYGRMILGTIGEDNRLDDTVISDTVNTVSRIESVCERLDKLIMISENLYNKLSDEDKKTFTFNELESISVKGKMKPLVLYECN